MIWKNITRKQENNSVSYKKKTAKKKDYVNITGVVNPILHLIYDDVITSSQHH